MNMERQYARPWQLTETELIEAMTPNIKYTCTALARRLNYPGRHVHTLLVHLVQSGRLRRMRGKRGSIYWRCIRKEAEGLGDGGPLHTLPMMETPEHDDTEPCPIASQYTPLHEP